MTDPRIITCEDCGGAGGWSHFRDIGREYMLIYPNWDFCPRCEGTGEREVTTTPITQTDLDANTVRWVELPDGTYMPGDEYDRKLASGEIKFKSGYDNFYIVEDDSE